MKETTTKEEQEKSRSNGAKNTKQPSLEEAPNKSVLQNSSSGSSKQSSEEAAAKMDKRDLPREKETLLETAVKKMVPEVSEPSVQTTTMTTDDHQEGEEEAVEVEHQEESTPAAPVFKYLLRSDNREPIQALTDKAAKLHAKRTGVEKEVTTSNAPNQATMLEPQSDPITTRSIALGTTKTSRASDNHNPTRKGLQQARAAARALQEKSEQNGAANNSNSKDAVKSKVSIAQPGAVSVASSFRNGEDPRTTHRTVDLGSSLVVVEQQPPEALHNVTEATLVDPEERIVEENRIRQDTINRIKASTAHAEVVDPLAERKRRINMFLCLLCVMGLLITVAVTATVAFVDDDDNTVVVLFPTRAELVQHAVRQEFGSESLDDQTSPQYVAVNWMAVNDTLLEFPLETEAERRAFRQRYVMCVLAFATGIETWVRQKNWLEPVDECTWSGLTCNDNKEVVAINTREYRSCRKFLRKTFYCKGSSCNRSYTFFVLFVSQSQSDWDTANGAWFAPTAPLHVCL